METKLFGNLLTRSSESCLISSSKEVLLSWESNVIYRKVYMFSELMSQYGTRIVQRSSLPSLWRGPFPTRWQLVLSRLWWRRPIYSGQFLISVRRSPWNVSTLLVKFSVSPASIDTSSKAERIPEVMAIYIQSRAVGLCISRIVCYLCKRQLLFHHH